MTLARERAIATAYLLAGDEDLREGVVAAQDMGVRVVLLGIEPLQPAKSNHKAEDDPQQEKNQADTLVREADEHIILNRDFLSPYIGEIQPPEISKAPIAGNNLKPEEHAGLRANAVTMPGLFTVCEEEGARFARTWVAGATEAEIHDLVSQFPRIPKELDVQLIFATEEVVGSLRERDTGKIAMRQGFWDVIRSAGTRSRG